MSEHRWFITYQYATYGGTRIVWADNVEKAVALVKREVRPSLPMPHVYETYQIQAAP